MTGQLKGTRVGSLLADPAGAAYHAGIESVATRIIVVSVLGLLACIVLVTLCVLQSRRDARHTLPNNGRNEP